MASRKKRKTAKRNPPKKRVSSFKASSKRKAHVKRAKPTVRNRTAKRYTARRARDTKRVARKQRSTSRDRKQAARSRGRIRDDVVRAARPKLKRNKQGGLHEYQGPKFGQTKFGGYKEALKRVGEEQQHSYDEAVESLREGLEEGLSDTTIKRRRNKVRKLARKHK